MEIPGFRIERPIAEGGMSTVYLAVQESLGRLVALKVLKRFDTPGQAERFLHEARIIASLEHRNIITIHDVGVVDDCYYLAMEHLEGGSLADRIDYGVPVHDALELLEAMAACLDFVHRRGIVHRDIKPSNILFHADGTPKLSDFGIAKLLEDDQEITLHGIAVGSPYYLSPEQAEGRPLDGRSDIYGLGIVFYQMLTGHRPYAEKSHVETIVAHLSQPIPVLPDSFADCQDLLERMIAKAPEQRFDSANELLAAVRDLRLARTRQRAAANGDSASGAVLTRAESGIGPQRRRLLVLGVMLGIAVGLAWWLGDEPQTPPADPAAAGVAEAPSPPAAAPLPAAGVPAYTDSGPEAREAVAGEPPSPTPASEPDPPPTATTEPVSMPLPEPEFATTETPAATPDERPAAEDLPETGMPEPDGQQPEPDVAATPEDAGEASGDTQASPVDRLMQAGDAALQANRLTRPRDDNAVAYYREVLALAPDHRGARAGIDRVADRYAYLADRAIERDNDDAALRFVERGLALRDDHPRLIAQREALARRAEARERPVETVAEVPAPPPEPTLRGEGSGDIVGDFQKVWRSVFE